MTETKFIPRFAGYADRIRQGITSQPFMAHIGARLTHISPGAVDLEVMTANALEQQHGFFHGGVITAIADSAAGYAALSLFDEDDGILTAELKINFLAPANGEKLIARGRVIKPGRTLTVCRAEVFSVDGENEKLVAYALLTMACRPGLKN